MIFQGMAVSASLQANGIAELTLDLQGEAVNKLDRLTLKELRQALDAIKGCADVRALLITSAKPMFIVGADITEFTADFKRPEAQMLESILSTDRLFSDLEDLPMPTAVAINGMALGGGFELCLAADLRVMSETARVGFPEVKLGLFPGYGGTVRLPRLVGLDNALQWIISGKDVAAAGALEAGAVDAVAPEQALLERSRRLLEQALTGEIDYLARRQRKLSALALPTSEAEVLIEAALHAIPPKTRINKSAFHVRQKAYWSGNKMGAATGDHQHIDTQESSSSAPLKEAPPNALENARRLPLAIRPTQVWLPTTEERAANIPDYPKR